MPTIAPIQQSQSADVEFEHSPGGAVAHTPHGAATLHPAVLEAVGRLDLAADASVLWLEHDSNKTRRASPACDDSIVDVLTARVVDVDRICVEDGPYDCVAADGVLPHVRWDRLIVRQLFCLVGPGGYLVLTVPISGRRWWQLRRPAQPLRTYSPQSLHSMLRKAGFDIVDSKTIDSRPTPNERTVVVNKRSIAFPPSLRPFSSLFPSCLRAFLPSCLFPPSSRRRDTLLVVAHKPAHAGRSARLDFTPTLNEGIDGFQTFYAGEFERLSHWEATHGRYLPTLNPAEAERRLARAKSALVLSPHPDDEVIGCGGTLLQMLERGVRVHVIQMTDGSASQALRDEDEHTRRTIRAAEARRVAQAMGFTQLTFLNARNGRLDESPPYVEGVRRAMDDMQPEIVFVPFINDRHPDHVAANLILDAALDGAESSFDPLVFSYEVWSLVPRHVAQPIDDVMQRKLDLLMLYPTPMRVVDYIRHCQVRDGRHARRCLGRDGYAEAFLALSRDGYRELLRAHRSQPAR